MQILPQFVHKISAKKQHEVAGVVRLVNSLAEKTDNTHVLDIGSGKVSGANMLLVTLFIFMPCSLS